MVVVVVDSFVNDKINPKKDIGFAYVILKIFSLNVAFTSVLSLKPFCLGVLLKTKDVAPPLIQTAAEIFITPLKIIKMIIIIIIKIITFI